MSGIGATFCFLASAISGHSILAIKNFLEIFFGLGPKKKRVEKKRVLYTFFSVD